MPRGSKKQKEVAVVRETPSYVHPEAQVLLRPEVGTQAQFRKKREPRQYRHDSSLAPQLSWDGKNWAREAGEWLLKLIEEAAKLPAPHEFIEAQRMRRPDGAEILVRGLADAVRELKALSQPFLDWAGKAERLSFQVPSLPLFVHERLSTRAILETLKGHRKNKLNQLEMLELFADPKHSITDQVLKAYEHKDDWVNRLILGDSLVVMNSLLAYEGMAGQVQMIYMDPPYGVKFGSNFQPFVRKRDVKHNDDEDLTREPERPCSSSAAGSRSRHDYFLRTPASKTLLPGFFRAGGVAITKAEYYLMAEQMLPSEIPPEVGEKLDLIADTFGIPK